MADEIPPTNTISPIERSSESLITLYRRSPKHMSAKKVNIAARINEDGFFGKKIYGNKGIAPKATNERNVARPV